MNDIDAAISKAHSAAEAAENEARQIEARIIKAGGNPPVRQYGNPVSAAAIRQNLTLVSVLNRRDPALASFLGVQSGSHRRDTEAREARAMQAKALAMETERLREVNAASNRYREQQQLAGANPLTGRRWGL
jgi:hypothetical protein